MNWSAMNVVSFEWSVMNRSVLNGHRFHNVVDLFLSCVIFVEFPLRC